MAKLTPPATPIAHAGALPKRRLAITSDRVTLTLVLVSLAALAYMLAPAALSAYNLERAGRLMAAGLTWPNPRTVDSRPRLRDNSALEQALGHLAAAIRWRPGNSRAYRMAGQVYAARADWQRAAEALEQARAVAPRNPVVAWDASLIYEQMWQAAENAPRDSLIETLAAGKLDTPDVPIKTPYCRDSRPQTCYFGTTKFELPYASFGENPTATAPVLFLHPPARLSASFTVQPDRPVLSFLLGLDPAARGWGSDGATFRVWVQPSNGPRTRAYEYTIDATAAQQGWVPGSADLSQWKGQSITLTIETDGGPAGNTTADWYGWANMAMTTVETARYASIVPAGRMAQAWSAVGFDAGRFFARGEQARNAGRDAEALTWYKRAISLDPFDGEAWRRSGSVYKAQGNWEKALEAYRQASRSSPDNRDIWYELGQLYTQRKDWIPALEAYRRGIAASSGQVGRSTLYLQLGNVLQSSSKPPDLKGAWAAYEQALSLDDYAGGTWAKVSTYNQRGYILAAQKRWDEAVQEYQRALALDGRAYWVYLSLANALWNLGKGDEAKATLRRAIELNPKLPNAYRLLGYFYTKDGAIQDARLMYSRVLELDPRDSKTRQALEGLGR